MQPLIRATHVREPSEDLIAAWMRLHDIDREEALRRIDADFAEEEIWVNDIYQVAVRRTPAEDAAHINIRRRDGNVIFRDWRHFQEIKNQVVGPECEAVELYPAESRLVDATNKYHLWASTDPTFRFPLGWSKRDVDTGKGGAKGMRQRPIATKKGGRP